MQKVGILSDSHDEIDRTAKAIQLLHNNGAETLVHCGDLTGPDIVMLLGQMPSFFVFGNHDCDMAGRLQTAANEHGVTCLGWGGEITLANKRVAVAHGHLHIDLRPLLEQSPDYMLTGHTHETADHIENGVRRINPGALHRAALYTVALLDLKSNELEFYEVD